MAQDDPVTAEYDVYLTPAEAEQILLLQYPNRIRNRPYNAHLGTRPDDVRIKPSTGHVELDIPLHTGFNFNKWQGLKWGDAMATSQDVHNKSATYGPAAGFGGTKPRGSESVLRRELKDHGERALQLETDLTGFSVAETDNKVMQKQTLGGQIVRHDGAEETSKPLYFIGAFRDNQLHLTKVDGTVQMRPQFHHIDAEEERAYLAASRAAAALEKDPRPPGEPRGLLMRFKRDDESEKDRLQNRTRAQLQAAEGEEWVKLEYVDEEEVEAFETFHTRMFLRDTDRAPRLKSGMDGEQYLDALSAPRREGVGRAKRKRPVRRKATEDVDDEDTNEAGAR